MQEPYRQMRLNPVQKEMVISYLEGRREAAFSGIIPLGILLAILTPVVFLEMRSNGLFGALFGFGFPILLIVGALFFFALFRGYSSRHFGPQLDRQAILKDRYELYVVEISGSESNPVMAAPFVLYDREGNRLLCTSPEIFRATRRGDRMLAVVCPGGTRYVVPFAEENTAFYLPVSEIPLTLSESAGAETEIPDLPEMPQQMQEGWHGDGYTD